MFKTIAVTAALLIATPAFAGGYHRHHHGHYGHYGRDAGIAVGILGLGMLGAYIASESRRNVHRFDDDRCFAGYNREGQKIYYLDCMNED